MRIADIHTHIFPNKVNDKATHVIGDFYDVQPELLCAASPENLLQYGAEAGITRFTIFSSALNAHQVPVINNFIAGLCQKNPCFLGLAALYPTMKNYKAEIDRLQDLNLRGVKIHSDFQQIPIDEPAAIDMYRELARRGLPVLFHMGHQKFDYSSPYRLRNLTTQVPDLIVIAAHFGGYRKWDEAYEMDFGPNVWFDTSSSLMFLSKEQALRLMEKLGPERFLFGTDFPIWSPAKELERFQALGLEKTLQEKILYGNYQKLFSLSD